MVHLKTFINAVLAGIMISIGGTVYLACDNKVCGALLFTVGLLTICVYRLALFTGKIGYIFQRKPVYLIECAVTWVGNLCGTVLTGAVVAYVKPDFAKAASTLVSNKQAQMPLTTIILGIFCGLLMYIAVDNFNQSDHQLGKYIGLFLCVSVFILAGFEHSIADMYYFSVAEGIPILTGKGFMYIILVSIGNLIGSWIMPNFKILGEKLASAKN